MNNASIVTDVPQTAPLNDATATFPTLTEESVGFDRALRQQLAQVPVFALGIVLINFLVHLVWQSISGNAHNAAPLVVVSLGMIVAAIIDGWAFKVPNWLTLSLVVSGWLLGLMHSLGVGVDGGQGGIGSALFGTLLGFLLLLPMLAIGGMGQGDVKMQMGFGAWIGAYFPLEIAAQIIVGAFCVGALVGGVFGIVIMLLRRRFQENAENFSAIAGDLQTAVTSGLDQANARAQQRRVHWVRLPYGVPLCVGFLGYLIYLQYAV